MLTVGCASTSNARGRHSGRSRGSSRPAVSPSARWFFSFCRRCLVSPIAAAVFFGVGSLSTSSSEAAEHSRESALPGGAARCERLAAAWTANGPGVDWSDLDPEQAIPACEQAVRAVPDDPDVKAYLCRALRKAERFGDSTPLCREAANAGSPPGQWEFGKAFYHGSGLVQDRNEAVAWFLKAAEKGYAPAQFSLGAAFWFGDGADIDYADAMDWFRKAAEQGHADAQFNIGMQYMQPIGVERDYSKAITWFRKAAKQGHALAQFNLGGIYFEGRGVGQDDAEAAAWYRKAAELGDADAQYILGLMFENGRGVDRDDAEALAWFRKAAEQGHADSQFKLGVMYMDGDATIDGDGDYVEAAGWFYLAAEQGNVDAQFNLAALYKNGFGVDQDHTVALYWYREAAKHGQIEAQRDLEVLSALYDPRAANALIDRLEDTDEVVCRVTASALGEIGDARAVQPLISLLNSNHECVRRAAFIALGELGDPRAVDPLIGQLNSEDEAVRAAAVTALGDLRDPRAVELLVGQLNGKDVDVRAAAISALGNLGDPRAVGALIALLDDINKSVRKGAARALGEIGDSRAIRSLIGLIADEDLFVRMSAAWSVQRIGGYRAVDTLVATLMDGDEIARSLAVQTLGLIGDPRAVEPLIARLSDDHEQRDWIATALGRIGDARAVEPLIACLNESNSEPLRHAAAFALATIGDARAVEPLIEILADEDEGDRYVAAASLGWLADSRAIEPLVGRLADEDEGVRRAASSALVRLGDSRAFEPLIARLVDEGTWERVSTIGELGKLSDPRVIEPLSVRLQDASALVREAAARALCLLGTSDSIPPKLIDTQPHILGTDCLAAPSYSANLLRLVHAAGAYSTAPQRNEIARLIWDWDAERAAGVTVEQLQRDFEALAGESDNLHGPAGENALVHLYLARLLLADPAADARRIAAAERHLEQARRTVREHETVLELMIAWLQGEAALRQDDPARAYERLSGAIDLLAQLRRPERELGLPLASYTLALSSYAASLMETKAECRYQERGHLFTEPCSTAALELSQQAEWWMDGRRDRFERWWDEQLDDDAAAEMALLISGVSVLARKRDNARILDDADRVLTQAQNLPLGWAARQAKLQLLEQLIAIAIDMADEATAHRYAEQLALERYRAARSAPVVAAAAAGAQQQQIASLLERQQAERQLHDAIARTEHDLRQAEAAGEQDKLDKLKSELKRLRKDERVARQALYQFQNTLKDSHPEIASLLGIEPLQVQQWSAQLRADQAILQYVLLDNHGYLFLFRGGEDGAVSSEVIELKIARAPLEAQIRRYRSLIAGGTQLRGSTSLKQDLDAALAREGERAQEHERALADLRTALSATLLGPLQHDGRLAGIDHLIVIPNGVLHELPWASLAWEDGDYLIEHFRLSQLPVASVLGATAKASPVSDRWWAMAYPTPWGNWARLDWTKAEVEAIAAHFPDSSPLLAEEATSARLLEADLQGATVHLAVHGEAAGPGRTHLVLSDGYLSDGEVVGLSVADSPLVVLSACETGLGERLSGDQVVSLSNAFLLAGARSVLSTLWKVPDQGTQALMTRFYAHLMQTSARDKAGALAAAQRELINAGYPPRAWAGVILTGL